MYYLKFKGGTHIANKGLKGGMTSKFLLFFLEGNMELPSGKLFKMRQLNHEDPALLPPTVRNLIPHFDGSVYSTNIKTIKVFYSETVNGMTSFYFPIFIEMQKIDDLVDTPDLKSITIKPFDADAQRVGFRLWTIGRILTYDEVKELLPKDSVSYKIIAKYRMPPKYVINEMISIERVEDILDRKQFVKTRNNRIIRI